MSLLPYISIMSRIRLKQVYGASKAILQNRISRYPESVTSLENRFATFTGTKHAISFCNGTSGIEAALYAADIGVNDEVIVPSCTFHSSIDPIVNAGARPVFADIDPASFTIDVSDVSRKITDRTRAIIVVHLFGTPANMEGLKALTAGRNIVIIEDTSHAHGAVYQGKICGSMGDFGVFSLQGDKAIAGGEGGIVVTNDRKSWIKMSMWGHFDRHANLFGELDCEDFRWTGIGYKRRMAPISAIIAAADFDFINQKNALFRKNTEILDAELSGIDGISISGCYPGSVKGGLFSGYPISINKGENAVVKVLDALKKAGITAYSWPYATHHKLHIYTNPECRVMKARSSHIPAYDQASYPVLPVTEHLNANGILLSKKYTCTLNADSRAKIRKVFRSF